MTDLVEQRHNRAEKTAWLLQVVPFIRFVGLTGSLAYDVAKKSSDIDLLIISKHDRIWTCRFFAVVLLRMFKLYRTGDEFNERAGKICPNRYVTDKYLLINPQNRYHAQDYTRMVPLFDSGNVYKKFLKKNNWMEKFGYFPPKRALSEVESAGILSGIRSVLEWILIGNIGKKFEVWAKKFQLRSIMKNPDVNKPDSGLYVDDNELRFHPDKR